VVVEEEHRPAAGQHHNHLRAHQPYRSKPTQAPKHHGRESTVPTHTDAREEPGEGVPSWYGER
jgi:hypothetical protein